MHHLRTRCRPQVVLAQGRELLLPANALRTMSGNFRERPGNLGARTPPRCPGLFVRASPADEANQLVIRASALQDEFEESAGVVSWQLDELIESTLPRTPMVKVVVQDLHSFRRSPPGQHAQRFNCQRRSPFRIIGLIVLPQMRPKLCE